MFNPDADDHENIRLPDEVRRMRLYSDSPPPPTPTPTNNEPAAIYADMSEAQQMECAMKMSREAYEKEELEIARLILQTKCEYEEKRMHEKQIRFVSLKPKLEKLMKLDKQNSGLYGEILNYILIYETDIDIDYLYITREQFEKTMGLLKTMRLDLAMLEYVMDVLRPTE